jgi:hypothetical protein
MAAAPRNPRRDVTRTRCSTVVVSAVEGTVAAGAGLVAVLLGAAGDVAGGMDGDAAGGVAELAGQACPDLLLGISGQS